MGGKARFSKLKLVIDLLNKKCVVPKNIHPPTTKGQWKFRGERGFKTEVFEGRRRFTENSFSGRRRKASKRQRTIDRKHKVILRSVVL